MLLLHWTGSYRGRQLYRPSGCDEQRDHHRSRAGGRSTLYPDGVRAVGASYRASMAAGLIIDARQERRIKTDLGGHVPKLEDGPWPAFPPI